MTDLPKYAAIEIERRWLVDLSAVGDMAAIPFRKIDDLYVSGTRLRLRRVVDRNGDCVFKLGKKYGKRSKLAEPTTTLYLTELEYRELLSLPGQSISKRRYSIEGGSLDIFEPPNSEIVIFEIEFSSEASATEYQPPRFATEEVTGDPIFSCHSLATAGAAQPYDEGRRGLAD